MTRFILVHGAFHGGWCWDEVADRLRAAGHLVEAPDLPGAPGEGTPHEEVSLDTAVRRVTDLLDADPEPAVLVGHSNGGVVITQAAAERPGQVSRLVYLAAFRPVDGECLLDLTSRPEGEGDGVQANVRVEPPSAFFDPDKIEEVFAADCTPERIADVQRRIGPQPLSMFATPVHLDGPVPPTTYVVCTEDGAIPVRLQRFMAGRNPATVVELEASHSPYYSRPDDVVEILLGTGLGSATQAASPVEA